MIGVSDFLYFNRGFRDYDLNPVLPYHRGCWEFQLVLGGECRVKFPEKRWVSAPAGSLFLFAPDCVHGWSGGGGDCEIVVFHVSRLPQVLNRWMEGRSWFYTEISEKSCSGIRASADHMPAIRRSVPVLRQLRVESILLDLSACLLENHSADFPHGASEASRLVDQGLSWMNDHLHEGKGVEEAAHAVGCSPQHLRRLFHLETGEGPGRHLTRMRISRTQELLHQGDYTLEEISEAVGYSCAAALSRAFKTETGMTPREYRRSNVEGGRGPLFRNG